MITPLTKALVKTLSKIILANGGEIFEPEKADIAVVGRVEKGNKKETPFRLPKGLLSERDKLNTVVYHTWISKCSREGKFVDSEGYRAPLVSFVCFKCRPLLSLLLSLSSLCISQFQAPTSTPPPPGKLPGNFLRSKVLKIKSAFPVNRRRNCGILQKSNL